VGREGLSDMLTGKIVKGTVTLPAYGTLILRRPHAG
jgi:hypothetical protein